MKGRILIAGLAMAGISATWAASDEPIKPIVAAKVTNPALVELGKKLLLRPPPVKVRLHLLQLLPQPVHGRLGQPEDVDRPQLAEGPDQLADGAQLAASTSPSSGTAAPRI
jgi:hypothetical protein